MKTIDKIRANKSYFEDFITRSTYHSNAIEGNTLSYADTYAIVFNDNSFKVTASPREIYEAVNHKYALNHILAHLDSELNSKLIIETAVLINKNISEISGYRTVSVFINGAEHIPPEPNMLNQAMMYFVHNYNNTAYDSIFQKIATNHIEFERIHPFSDGNGRTGRLLINYELLRNDFAPIVVPKDERSLYFQLIAEGNIKGMTEYFESLCHKEQERLEQFCRGSGISRPKKGLSR